MHARVRGREKRTRSPWALENNLLGGDHGEPSTDVLMDSVTELGPGAALYGALAEAGVSKFPSTRGSGDLNLVAVVIEPVLNDLLDPVLVGPDHLPRRQQEVQVLCIVLLQFPPSELRLLRRSHRVDFPKGERQRRRGG